MNDERSANAIDRRIGQRLKARRLEIGVSQEKLADLLGVTFQQIQKYEKGVNRVAASRLFDIAAALDVPIAHFFDGLTLSGQAGVAEDGLEDLVYDTLATADGLELMRLYGAIRNPRVKRRVLELVRVMAEDAADAGAEPGAAAEN
jgi:transcriptional regulator with XRE-family HTH domain